jgi:hypothetical protein
MRIPRRVFVTSCDYSINVGTVVLLYYLLESQRERLQETEAALFDFTICVRNSLCGRNNHGICIQDNNVVRKRDTHIPERDSHKQAADRHRQQAADIRTPDGRSQRLKARRRRKRREHTTDPMSNPAEGKLVTPPSEEAERPK